MIFFCQPKKRTLFLWALFLSVALLSAQGIKLHVHSLGHDPQHSQIATQTVAEHSHLSEAHLSTDVSHGDHHHNEVASELDVSPQGLLKKVSSSTHALALLITVFILLLPVFYRQRFHRHRDEGTTLWRYHLSPPLRAPPL